LGNALFPVDFIRVFQHRIDRHPLLAVQTLVKTAAPAGMAGDTADLLDLQHDDIVVAIEANLADALLVTGFLALVSQLLPRARPVHRGAAGRRRAQRVTVHPGHHQDAPVGRVLRDGRHQDVIGPLDRIQPVVAHCSNTSGRPPEMAASALRLLTLTMYILQPHLDTLVGHVSLGLADRVFTKVKNTGSQHRVRTALGHALGQVLQVTDTT